MTDAPERIWAGPNGEYWSTEDIGSGIDVEYVRKDIYREALMQSIASGGQAQEAYEEQIRLEKENVALRESLPQWQDISTAPKYEAVLVWDGENAFEASLRYDDEWWASLDIGDYENGFPMRPQPTNWMPLPKGPK